MGAPGLRVCEDALVLWAAARGDAPLLQVLWWDGPLLQVLCRWRWCPFFFAAENVRRGPERCRGCLCI